MKKPTIGMSSFARDRHTPTSGRTYFNGTEQELIDLVHQYWYMRTPGNGETGIDRKVVVQVDPARFIGSTTIATEHTVMEAKVERRQPGEDPFIRVMAVSEGYYPISVSPTPEAIKFAKVVCYSKAALLENGGERSTDADWEIIALLASPVEDEPMHPLTMARNMLELPGGTKGTYTAEEFARSIVYWSCRCAIRK